MNNNSKTGLALHSRPPLERMLHIHQALARELEAIHKLRRTMVDLNPIEAMETLTAALKKFKTNDEFLVKMATGS